MIPLSAIQAKCEEYFEVGRNELFNRSRAREFADARKAFRMIADRSGYTTKEVSECFAGYERGSIATMLTTAEDLFLTDKKFHAKIMQIERELKPEETPDPKGEEEGGKELSFEESVLLRLERIERILELLTK